MIRTPLRRHAARGYDLGADRLRVVINACTRLRFVDSAGRMDFKAKDGSGPAPPGLRPWFEAKGRRSAGQPIAFGHWSTLGLVDRADLARG